MKLISILLTGLLVLPVAATTPILDLDFTGAEGFADGISLDGTAGMSTQPGWYAGDTGGAGYAASTGSWYRAKNSAAFTLGIGHSVVVETTLRLTDSDGSFSNNKDLFKAGFAEQSLHAGNSIPAVGARLHSYADGSCWFGGDQANSRISVGSASVGDSIRLKQIITRSATSNEFVGLVSGSNLTSGVDLGSASAYMIQSATNGEWGGVMNPSFRMLDNPGMSSVELDRWIVYTTTSSVPVVVTNLPPQSITNGPVHVLIDPAVSVAIDGHLMLDRKQFFSLSDTGRSMESKVSNSTQVDYYINDLGMNFGRELGGAYGVVGWNKAAVKEDASRPGYVDMANLANKLNGSNGGATTGFINHFSPNLNIATHDRYGNVPSFMPTWVASGDNATHTHATNSDAYGEFVAGVLEYGYTDWTRPATYEIVNEPHWTTTPDQRFADLHTSVQQKVKASRLDVAVGGPCMSVGYFYKNNYQNFGMEPFIINTGCNLDFYSFHVYDYMQYDAGKNDFVGRVSSGLPIDGVLDMVQNYTHLNYGKGVDMVLSEHGGYISSNQELALDTIANTYFPSNSFPGTGFEWEMKRRSVSECLAVRSAIANTMTFMNHPHVIRKAVPFILLESASWDPRYYSTLLVKENFDKNSSIWHESTYVNFFRFFQDVAGRRVRILLDDPDIQSQAFASGNTLYILLNNLSDSPEELQLDVPAQGMQSVLLRRFNRNADFTPNYTEQTTNTLDGLVLGSREALAAVVTYSSALSEKVLLDEVPYYGDTCRQSFTGSRTFNVAVPDFATAQDAVLRIGVDRSSGANPNLNVVFNGTSLSVPLEDSTARLDDGTEYASTKIVRVPVGLLQANNVVQVSFPDGGSGGIGAVVIRTETEIPRSGNVFGINCAGPLYTATDGTVYQADAYFSSSSTGTDSLNRFGNTPDDPLYKNERYGNNFSYHIPVTNGDYAVTLHLAENWFSSAGSRVFNVNLEGASVIAGLDLYATAGRANAADQTFTTTVSDGSLDIDFSRTTDNAKINAIRIEQQIAPASLPSYSQWALDQGLSGTNAQRTLDLDGDGFNNRLEFIAATAPNDASSYFVVNGHPAPTTGFTVSFPSALNRSYSIDVSDDLMAGWIEITNGIPGTGSSIDVIDAAGQSNRFYRIKASLY